MTYSSEDCVTEPHPIARELADRALATDTVGMLEGLTTTRAIRRYHDEPVPVAVLRDIMFAATRAPSGSNRQPFRFLVLTDGPKAAEAKQLIQRSALNMWGAKSETDGYGAGSGSREGSPKARMNATMREHAASLDRVPALIFPCLVRYREPVVTEGGSIYPACQNLLLAARALGYGGVLAGWHHSVDAELRELLGIPVEGVAIAATITLGRPMGSQGPVRRRPMAELVFSDTWGAPASFAVDPPGTQFTAAGPPKPAVAS
jgi:nitroreductase